MKRLLIDEQNKTQAITEAVKVLRNGGLIVFPTETAYGVGALATNSEAVTKLLQYKERPVGKAISVAVADRETAERYVEINNEADQLFKQFLPGPLTVVCNSKHYADTRLESEKATLGIRIPDFDFTLKLLKELKEGISATSANRAGKKTPYSIEDILANNPARKTEMLDLILDYGELPKRPTSTVIDTTTLDMQVIRSGAISFDTPIIEKEITSYEEMIDLGTSFTKENIKGKAESLTIISFNAELGAGKTQFMKGVALALGINETIKSPTYSLLNEYDTHDGLKLIHIDTWRMASVAELEEVLQESYFAHRNIIAIEWAGAAEEMIREKTQQAIKNGVKVIRFNVEILYTNKDTRRIKIVKSHE